jgi:hypothetical protein
MRAAAFMCVACLFFAGCYTPGSKMVNAAVAPDGTMWLTRLCQCPVSDCQRAMDADCHGGGYEVEGYDAHQPLPEWGASDQRRGYELRYRCLHDPNKDEN